MTTHRQETGNVEVDFTRDEMMTIATSRQFADGSTHFVGIGQPAKAAALAIATGAPHAILVFESGAIGARPDVFPMSIGDADIADSADLVVSLPEIFAYWLQGGLIDVGFLGAAQIDRFANLNSTVIGPYDRPTTRLPGAGGAPEIGEHAHHVVVTMRHTRRAFVPTVDFVSTPGFLDGGGARARLGLAGAGPQAVITDLGILAPQPVTDELQLISIHPGVELDEVRDHTGWDLRVHRDLMITTPPTSAELTTLRAIAARTAARGMVRDGSGR